MERSESIAALAAALSATQAEMAGAAKDSTNPHFNSRYADLASAWEACRGPLTRNGLAVVQFPRAEGGCVQIETVLTHKSGEFMSDTLTLPVSKQDAQGYGSAITYGRRYSLMSVLGIAPEDDDGNAASVAGQAPAQARKSAAQAKRDGDAEKVKAMIGAALTVEELDSRWEHIEAEIMPTLPIAWADPMRDAYETKRQQLSEMERA
jgi:hypothetical protein